MEKLLHWSIEAAKNPQAAGNPDPELLSKLFSGYDDHTAMKVNLQEAVEAKDLDKRLEALDVFEELVENVDNANDLGNLWAPLLWLCQDSESEVRQLALSSVAYAVQNNDKAQNDLLNTKEGLAILMQRCTDSDLACAAKAVFATAAAIGHNPVVYDSFVEKQGLELVNTLADQLRSNGNYNKRDLKFFSLVYSILNLEPKRHTLPVMREVLEKLQGLPRDSQGKIAGLFEMELTPANTAPASGASGLARGAGVVRASSATGNNGPVKLLE